MTYPEFENKYREETITLTFDYSDELVGAEVLTGTPTAVVSILDGARASMLTILACVISNDQKSLLVRVSGGVIGTRYLIRTSCATTSATTRVLGRVGSILVE